MDPNQNRATLFAKLNSLIPPSSRTSRQQQLIDANMRPPAYDTVVDANQLTSNRNPYTAQDENEAGEAEDDGREIIINAATQIRGHGNIISVVPLDGSKIADIVSKLLRPESSDDQGIQSNAESVASPVTSSSLGYSRTEVSPTSSFSKISITMNCGATVIGDRNIVGPGLGDVVHYINVQRNQQAARVGAQGATPTQSPAASVSRGAKRKADEDASDSSEVKKVKTDGT
ncbi:hypothetical protein CC78DRAFT_577524 [Lojkania enalia]|uniref:Uncharacterized protein n=1 Tax=Lojkania enalia TaxID=147567 RepID=A0A9P4KIG7_9PLEO|nr:hypothetical protein CC78DRAFT_577524 [Didymosphaeria enalia]